MLFRSVTLQCVTSQYGVLVVAGPHSRALLQKLTDADLSHGAFPWLSGQFINIGIAQAHALRVNFVGELGWELHHPIEMQNTIFDALMKAGSQFDLKPFGIRAMDSMRLEKSYRLIPRELSIEYSALESALDRFVRLNDADFIGRSLEHFVGSHKTLQRLAARDSTGVKPALRGLPGNHASGMWSKRPFVRRFGFSLDMQHVQTKREIGRHHLILIVVLSASGAQGAVVVYVGEIAMSRRLPMPNTGI